MNRSGRLDLAERDALARRIDAVREAIARAVTRSDRRPADVQLVAVSKTVGPEAVAEAARLGVTTLGENRVQEAEAKITALTADPDLAAPSPLAWHLIGHLQSNKARLASKLFTTIQSVDSVELAALLDRHARERDAGLDVLVEVNVGGEASKFGFTPEDIVAAFPSIVSLSGLRVRGLMTVAPIVANPEDARPYFIALRELRDRLVAGNPRTSLPDLSMGMTGDYAVAIEEGATIVRIGRAIFGDRPA